MAATTFSAVDIEGVVGVAAESAVTMQHCQWARDVMVEIRRTRTLVWPLRWGKAQLAILWDVRGRDETVLSVHHGAGCGTGMLIVSCSVLVTQ